MEYGKNPEIEPGVARMNCCKKWYGNDDCEGEVKPGLKEMLKICTLAQMDLYFDSVNIKPKCTEEEARFWCENHTKGTHDPCIEEQGACYNTN